MSEDRRPGRSRLVVMDKKIVAVEAGEDGATYDKDGKRIRPPGDFMQQLVSRKDMMDHLAVAALEVGQKMYDQMSGETADFLRDMEASLREEIRREFEKRTPRGRWQAFKLRFRHGRIAGWLMEFGLLSPLGPTPALVDATVALDPGVQAAAKEREEALTELRRRIVVAGPKGGNIELPVGTTNEDAQRIDREIHPEEYEEARVEVAATLKE